MTHVTTTQDEPVHQIKQRSEPCLPASVLQRIVRLVISVRRELISIAPRHRRKPNPRSIENSITIQSLESSFYLRQGVVQASDANRDGEFVLQQTIFETAQHAWKDLIVGSICRADAIASKRESFRWRRATSALDVDAEIAKLTSRHHTRSQDTVAALLAAQEDVAQVVWAYKYDASAKDNVALRLAIWSFACMCAEQFAQQRCDKAATAHASENASGSVSQGLLLA
jgi:hypothetical protein